MFEISRNDRNAIVFCMTQVVLSYLINRRYRLSRQSYPILNAIFRKVKLKKKYYHINRLSHSKKSNARNVKKHILIVVQ